jgi:hypothetical protein
MNFKSESHAVSAFIKNMPASWHIQKIETSTGSGVPDLNVAIPDQCPQRSRELWIEVKNGPGAHIQPFQVAWWIHRLRAGGIIWVLWFDNGFTLHRVTGDTFISIAQVNTKILHPKILWPDHTGKTWELLQRTLEAYS